jgi:hypothetical protein
VEIHQIPSLRSPVMVIAFSGWNDAAEAATGALSHLLASWTDPEFDVVPELVADVDPEDFYDFQVNRPMVEIDESSVRALTWPGTQIFALKTPNLEHDFVVVRGVEPSMKWKTFTADLLDLADDLEVDLVITLGSMLADAPHTRPITVSGSGAHQILRNDLGLRSANMKDPLEFLELSKMVCASRSRCCFAMGGRSTLCIEFTFTQGNSCAHKCTRRFSGNFYSARSVA